MEENNTLYHYCSNAAFLSIIRTRCIWLSELSLSNDIMEGKWIRNVFAEMCDAEGISIIQKKEILERLDITIDHTMGFGFCLSTNSDQLSQWRGYSENATGVSIGFDANLLRDVIKINNEDQASRKILLREVIYDFEKQKECIYPEFKAVVRCVQEGALRSKVETILTPVSEVDAADISRLDERISMIMVYLSFKFYQMKNKAFDEEMEWRILSSGPKNTDHVLGFKGLEYKETNQKIVPYHAFHLNQYCPELIKSVWLGPRNGTPPLVVREFLKSCGMVDAQVFPSSASFR